MVTAGIATSCRTKHRLFTKWMKSHNPNDEKKYNKSSAVAEMGDRGHNTHVPTRGGCCTPFAERWEPV